jgi:hypothetical protein
LERLFYAVRVRPRSTAKAVATRTSVPMPIRTPTMALVPPSSWDLVPLHRPGHDVEIDVDHVVGQSAAVRVAGIVLASTPRRSGSDDGGVPRLILIVSVGFSEASPGKALRPGMPCRTAGRCPCGSSRAH